MLYFKIQNICIDDYTFFQSISILGASVSINLTKYTLWISSQENKLKYKSNLFITKTYNIVYS